MSGHENVRSEPPFHPARSEVHFNHSCMSFDDPSNSGKAGGQTLVPDPVNSADIAPVGQSSRKT